MQFYFDIVVLSSIVIMCYNFASIRDISEIAASNKEFSESSY